MRYALSAVVLLHLHLGGTPSLADEPGLHGFTLDNGLSVVVIEDHRAPVVTQMLWYRVGSAEDPSGKSGLAHFLEHLMFKATHSLAEGEFERTVEENGGSYNAFTSIDSTGYAVRIAADRLGLVMRMEADRMVNLAPDERSVAAERDVVIEERRQVVDGNPAGALRERLMPELYPSGPDRRPTIGSEQEIAGLTLEDALDFYRAHYVPNNAILVVAGDVRSAEVRQMAEQHFGPVAASTAVVRGERPQERPRQADGPIEIHDPRTAVPQLTRLYLAPQRRAEDQKQAAALVVLADLLGSQRVTSIMARELVGEDAIALAAGTSYSDTGLNRQPFVIYLVPRPGVERVAAERALDALLAAFLDQGPDPEEIERIKGRVRGSNIYLLDDVAERATRIGEALATGLTLRDVEAWPDLLESVTADDVRTVAIDLFRTENSVTGWLLPPDLPPREPRR